MTHVLVATSHGLRVFGEDGQRPLEMPGEQVRALTAAGDGEVIAVVGAQGVWRRMPAGAWSLVARTSAHVDSLAMHRGALFVGSMNEPALFRASGDRKLQRVVGFDHTPGREEWFAQGPPLSIRAMTSTADGSAIMATVHVGGIPRSTDGGETWHPTVPVAFDVHEARAHPTLPNIVAAAAAVGLCTSVDGGATWSVISKGGMDPPHSLAVALLEEEALFSLQEGPFAKRAQIWRWRIGTDCAEPVRDGLPEWLDGKIDTAHIGAGDGRAAIVDGAGTVWLSEAGARGWRPIARNVRKAIGIALVHD